MSPRECPAEECIAPVLSQHDALSAGRVQGHRPPISGKIIEAACEADESVFEKFVSGEKISNEELQAAIRKATIAIKVTPVLCGSAFKNKGVQPLLDAVVNFLPSPVDIPAVQGWTTDRSSSRS